ncbi:MAG: hypothetical protein RR547_08090 [Raoultibacter sp.]
MHDLLLLLKVQVLGLFGLNKALHADRTKALRSIALLALAAVAIGVLCVGYSMGAANALVQFGLTDFIPVVAVFVGAMAGAVSAFAKANGVLFGFKDYDIIMSLPVKTLSVVLSRLAALYTVALVFSLIAMVPALGVYFAQAGASFASIVIAFLTVFLAPLLPMALAVLLAVGISALASRMRHANIVSVVLSLVVVVVAIVLPYAAMGSTGFDTADLAALVGNQLAMIESAVPLIAWAQAGIVEGNIVAFAGFSIISLGLTVLVVALINRWFTSINSALMASRPKGTFSFEKQATERLRSPFAALLAKEGKRLTSTPIYLMNSCIGFMLIVVAGVAAVVASVLGYIPEVLMQAPLAQIMGVFLPWGVAFFVGISATTAASVSLEGKNRWLMYTAPVSAKAVLGAKLALTLVIATPCVVVGSILLAVAFRLDAVSAGMIVVIPLAVCAFTAVFGLVVDASRPRFDWTSEYEPVKRSLAVSLTVLSGFVVMVLGVLISIFLGVYGMIAFAAILVVIAWVLFSRTAAMPLQE